LAQGAAHRTPGNITIDLDGEWGNIHEISLNDIRFVSQDEKNAGIVDGYINYPGLEAAVLCQTSFLSCATINNGHMAPMGQNYMI